MDKLRAIKAKKKQKRENNQEFDEIEKLQKLQKKIMKDETGFKTKKVKFAKEKTEIGNDY